MGFATARPRACSLTMLTRAILFALREKVGAAAHVLQPQRAGARRLAEHHLGVIAAEALVQLLQQRLAVQLDELRRGQSTREMQATTHARGTARTVSRSILFMSSTLQSRAA